MYVFACGVSTIFPEEGIAVAVVKRKVCVLLAFGAEVKIVSLEAESVAEYASGKCMKNIV